MVASVKKILKGKAVLPFFVVIGFMAFAGYGVLAGNRIAKEKMAKAEDYPYYLVEAKREAAYAAHDPAVSLKDITVFMGLGQEAPVYAVYRYSSVVTAEAMVAYNLETGGRVFLDKAMSDFVTSRKIGSESLDLESLPRISGLFSKTMGKWRSVYISRSQGETKVEGREFDGF